MIYSKYERVTPCVAWPNALSRPNALEILLAYTHRSNVTSCQTRNETSPRAIMHSDGFKTTQGFRVARPRPSQYTCQWASFQDDQVAKHSRQSKLYIGASGQGVRQIQTSICGRRSRMNTGRPSMCWHRSRKAEWQIHSQIEIWGIK